MSQESIRASVLAKSLRRAGRFVARHRTLVPLGAAILAIPVFAIASPLTTPHTFTPGTVISSTEVNQNFAAIENAVDDNDARISALEDVSLSGCEWAVNSSNTNSGWRQVDCPAGMNVVSGGCNASNSTVVRNMPYLPQDGTPVTGVSSWLCEFQSSATGHRGYALCCNP